MNNSAIVTFAVTFAQAYVLQCSTKILSQPGQLSSNRLNNWFDNRLYCVNGVSGCQCSVQP